MHQSVGIAMCISLCALVRYVFSMCISQIGIAMCMCISQIYIGIFYVYQSVRYCYVHMSMCISQIGISMCISQIGYVHH